jgi:hypothetical protein
VAHLARATVASDLVGDGSQGLLRSQITVEHRERFAIVSPDADLEPRSVEARDDPSHLEAQHLTRDLAVLDDHIQTGLTHQVGERLHLIGNGRRLGPRCRNGRLEGTTFDPPRGGDRRELTRSARQHAGIVTDDVELGNLFAISPGQRGPERSIGWVVGEKPTAIAVDVTDRASEELRLCVDVEVVGEQSSQLCREKRGAVAQASGAFLRRP